MLPSPESMWVPPPAHLKYNRTHTEDCTKKKAKKRRRYLSFPFQQTHQQSKKEKRGKKNNGQPKSLRSREYHSSYWPFCVHKCELVCVDMRFSLLSAARSLHIASAPFSPTQINPRHGHSPYQHEKTLLFFGVGHLFAFIWPHIRNATSETEANVAARKKEMKSEWKWSFNGSLPHADFLNTTIISKEKEDKAPLWIQQPPSPLQKKKKCTHTQYVFLSLPPSLYTQQIEGKKGECIYKKNTYQYSMQIEKRKLINKNIAKEMMVMLPSSATIKKEKTHPHKSSRWTQKQPKTKNYKKRRGGKKELMVCSHSSKNDSISVFLMFDWTFVVFGKVYNSICM